CVLLTMSMTAALGGIRGGIALPLSRTEPQVTNDLEYGRADGESLRLDLYVPAHDLFPTVHPALIFVHGGGWSGGDKGEYTDKAQEMAGRGYVTMTVNYRLVPKHRYPAAVQDVQAAVRWARSHAAEYSIDPARIGAIGASAGGHLVSMLGVKEMPDEAGKLDKFSARVACVVDYYGREDLNLEPTGTGFFDYRQGFIGKTKAEAPQLYTEASPITYVDKRSAPFLILQGARDTQVQPIQSQILLAALDKAGVEASLLLLAGAGHGFGGQPGDTAWDTAKAFLDRHLHPVPLMDITPFVKSPNFVQAR
ncbi:MAG: alpha/beta hydrolase, partial [Armatimonadota bacterium]|nr:alpha/beta hydrolase [Armatimonadota bacterium]